MMARPLRIECSGAFYHVTARGNAQQDIFLYDEDRQQFFRCCRASSSAFMFCSMPTV